MYAPSAFKVHQAIALKFAAARGFGLVVACDGGRPIASMLPFLLIEGRRRGAARALFMWRAPIRSRCLRRKGGTWMIAVSGYDAYVSPDWYASPDQCRPWLYEAVQACPGRCGRCPPAIPRATLIGWLRYSKAGTRRSRCGRWSACRLNGATA